MAITSKTGIYKTLSIAGALAATLISSSLRAQETEFKIYYGNRPAENKIAISGPDVVPSKARAFLVEKIVTIEGAPIDAGVILTKDGKITAIGKASETAIPEGYEVIDLGSAWCAPGLIDLHCHVAAKSFDINDTVHQTNPEMRTIDLVTMDHTSLRNALAGGVTTVLYIPGSGSNMGGFGTLTKTAGRTPEEALIRFPGCLKIAQAGNPERRAGDLGSGVLGMNQGLRMTLTKGKAYHEEWEAFDRGEGPKPDLQPALEYLRGLFRHEYPVCVHTQGYQVALQTLRELRTEMGLWTVIVHGTFDSFMLSEECIKRGVPVCNGPRQFYLGPNFLGSLDTGAAFTGCAAAWYAGGKYGFHKAVPGLGKYGIGINTDSPVVPEEQLIVQVAMAVRLGLPDDIGMRSVTQNPADFVGVGDRIGSLRVGKDADLSIWSGDPLDPRNHVVMTVVNGSIAYRRAADRPRF